jgi:hypothetical protein
MDVKISCVNERYWSGNNKDRFWLVVDIYRNGIGKTSETYFYDSMEGELLPAGSIHCQNSMEG